MNREVLLAAITQARADLDAALDGLTADEMQAPGVVGEWSIKDLLAHLTVWQVHLLTCLFKAQRGQKPGKMKWSPAEIEAQNKKLYQEYLDRPLENVLADYRGINRQVLRVVAGLSDSDLAGPDPWGLGKTLSYFFQDWVAEHEAEHLPDLLAWRKAKARGANGAA